MLSADQYTLKNLRLIAVVSEGEYLGTDEKQNIEYVIQDGKWNTVKSAVWGETFITNLAALKKCYVDEVPPLIKRLIEQDCSKELTKLRDLLVNSKDGLKNLKKVFCYGNEKANIDCLIEDYLDTQLDYLSDYFDSNSDSECTDEKKEEDDRI